MSALTLSTARRTNNMDMFLSAFLRMPAVPGFLLSWARERPTRHASLASLFQHVGLRYNVAGSKASPRNMVSVRHRVQGRAAWGRRTLVVCVGGRLKRCCCARARAPSSRPPRACAMDSALGLQLWRAREGRRRSSAPPRGTPRGCRARAVACVTRYAHMAQDERCAVVAAAVAWARVHVPRSCTWRAAWLRSLGGFVLLPLGMRQGQALVCLDDSEPRIVLGAIRCGGDGQAQRITTGIEASVRSIEATLEAVVRLVCRQRPGLKACAGRTHELCDAA